MKLRIMMYCFYRLFVFTAFRSSEFKEKLKERDVVLVMKAKDKKIARTFIFKNGNSSSFSGAIEGADCSLIWLTAKEGGAVMFDVATGDGKALMKAVVNGRLILEGDAIAVTWYMAIVSMLGRIYRRKKKKDVKTRGNPG